jgi:hypothetical protein
MTTQPNIPNSNDVSPKRLWFGFTSGAIAWTLAGLFDVIVVWHTCSGAALGSTAVFTDTGLRVLLGIITFGLLAIATVGGIVSYDNWRRLSEGSDFVPAEGRGRKQYMALTGVLMSGALGVGIIWFSIPIYILKVCVRAR